MNGKRLAAVLVVLSLPAFGVFVASVPVADVRMHDTSPYLGANASVENSSAVRVVAYENLTERGRELYRTTLERGGRYWVPIGEGASDYRYVDDPGEGFQSTVIERPADAALPPADERHAERYDLLVTTTRSPPLFSGAYLVQMASLLVGGGLALAGAYLYVTRRR